MIKMSFSDKYLWIYRILIGVFLLICFELILPFILKIIKRKIHPPKYDWKAKLREIFYRPIQILIWIVAIWFIVISLAEHFKFTNILEPINKTKNIAIIIDIAWIFIRWKKEIQKEIIVRSEGKIDKTSIEFLGKILSVFIIFIALLLILQKLGINVMPLIAFGGVGAAAFAFAAKDVLANFFGGLMLYITRPFVNNDLVEIPSLNILGNIEHIGWYSTCVRELEKVPVYIPNSIFSNAIIKNSSRRTHRRIEETIKIRYVDFSKITYITDEIKKNLSNNKDIDNSFSPLVYFTTYSDYSLDIMLKVYTKTTEFQDFLRVKEEVLLNIKTILDNAKADFPYPVTSIDFLNQPNK